MLRLPIGILERPWCYHCERNFDDQQVLQTHQREVHFPLRPTATLNTANGLSVHTLQVHKAPITAILNSVVSREGPNVGIFGVFGIPEDLMQAHRQKHHRRILSTPRSQFKASSVRLSRCER